MEEEQDSSAGKTEEKQQEGVLVRSEWRCSCGRRSNCTAAASWNWGCCGEEDDEDAMGGRSRRPSQLTGWTSSQQEGELRSQQEEALRSQQRPED